MPVVALAVATALTLVGIGGYIVTDIVYAKSFGRQECSIGFVEKVTEPQPQLKCGDALLYPRQTRRALIGVGLGPTMEAGQKVNCEIGVLRWSNSSWIGSCKRA